MGFVTSSSLPTVVCLSGHMAKVLTALLTLTVHKAAIKQSDKAELPWE